MNPTNTNSTAAQRRFVDHFHVSVEGRIGRIDENQPLVFTSQTGLEMAILPFAVEVSGQGQTDSTGAVTNTKTLWMRVKLFGKQATSIARWIKKGMKVQVTGRLAMDIVRSQRENENGETVVTSREAITILADRIVPIDMEVLTSQRAPASVPVPAPVEAHATAAAPVQTASQAEVEQAMAAAVGAAAPTANSDFGLDEDSPF